MNVTIVERPSTFDRVDHIKWARHEAGEEGITTEPGDDRLWILGGPLTINVDARVHVIPTGFTTDGSSIPRWGWPLAGLHPWEPPQRWAVVVHDWLYSVSGAAKPYADRVFREVLRSEDAPWWQREILYVAVVVGGHSAYKIKQYLAAQIFE